jgi:hypothetical protein
MAIPKSIKAQLAEYEYLIRLQMAKIEELAQENAQLKEGLSAHQTLRLIYSDPNTSQGNRIRAAQAALQHEMPRLLPVQQLELKAAEEPEPLADLVERRRARQNRLCPQSTDLPPIEALPLADGRSRNGNGDDSDKD